MADEKPQFKVLCSDETQLNLHNQSKPLGFHTSNQLASVYLTALSEIPADKVWEALAMIRRYKSAQVPKNPRRKLL